VTHEVFLHKILIIKDLRRNRPLLRYNPNINANATAAGINLDAANNLSGFLEVLRGFQNGLDLPNPVSPETLALQDIQFHWPYAEPFALFALAAGVEAAYQAVQQPPSS
jgi:hypothetical protein